VDISKRFAEISPCGFEKENIWAQIQQAAVSANKMYFLLIFFTAPLKACSTA
jgi:hypothetical protein